MTNPPSAILGIGTDIIEIERIRDNLTQESERFLNRLFTPAEQAYCAQHKDSAPHVAGRFCAKEAIVKALGVGVGAVASWLDIEILNDAAGKPIVHLSPKLQKNYPASHVLVSISHCRLYATATAILQSRHSNL